MTDEAIARSYISKIDNAKTNGHEFSLSFNQYKKLVSRKTCFYTSLPFNKDNTDYKKTIDRIDNSKGYVPGNVVVCLNVVNNIKSALENPNNQLTVHHLRKMCNSIIKLKG